MTKEQQSVKTWMTKAGQECPDKPTLPSLEVRKLRARLILEEALETINKGLAIDVRFDDSLLDPWVEIRKIHFFAAADLPDLIELADGMADLQYVNLGTAVACGIDLEPIFEEVCRSNDSKFWSGSEVDYLKNPSYSFRSVGDNEFCATDSGGKIMKSPSFRKPNLHPHLTDK